MLRAEFEVIKVTYVIEEEEGEYAEYLFFPIAGDPTKEKKFVIKPGDLKLRMYGPIEEGEGLELGDKVHFYISRPEDSPPSVEYIQEQIDKAGKMADEHLKNNNLERYGYCLGRASAFGEFLDE